MENYIDVAIIGGGASGLCTALSLKQKNINISVAVFEQLQRVGKKLITTGNGRCNITNKNLSLKRYHSENPEFFKFALNKYSNCFAENFFNGLGVLFKSEEDKVYPYSLQASSVVDALRFGIDRMGVKLYLETEITDTIKKNGNYIICSNDKKYFAKTVVIATGLLSGGKKLGSSGSMLKILKNKGYSVIPTTPSIVQIKTDNSVTKSLKGIKVEADATLVFNDKKLKTESGEVLFCDYGLSGPPILQLSREVSRKNGKFYILLDLMPEYSFDDLVALLNDRTKALSDSCLEEFFTGMLNKRVGQQLIKFIGKPLKDNTQTLSQKDIKALAFLIKNLRFEVLGTTGFENSQVTAGGLDTEGFEDKTMMSKKDKGLFAVGEVLDVDGDCGGFNLQWAWSSAFCASDAIIKYLGV